MKKPLLACLSALLACATLATGCSSGGKKVAATSSGSFNATGYPIMKEKTNLNVIVACGSFYGDFNKMPYFQQLEEKTNIHLNVTMYTQDTTTKINLIFASQSYPDIMLGGPSDAQITNAAGQGDVLPLNDLIKKYAPTWQKFLDSDKYAKKVITMSDGKIYSLPNVRQEESNYGIRDQNLINSKWLNELGLSVPKTTDDLYNVLKAFKQNAGKGSIPSNVIPWLFRFNNYYNGGQYDLYSSFGVFTPGDTAEYISVDEKGKVYFSATDSKIKEPIKYLNKLYKEGLIPAEIFTDDQTAMDAKALSKPAVVGLYSHYFNDDSSTYSAMPALTAPGVSKAMVKIQNNTINRNYFTIFKNNKYPEASIRLADTIAQPDWSIQAMYGTYGKWLQKDGDKITQLPFTGNEVSQYVPGNNVPFLLTDSMMKNFTYNGSQQAREDTIQKVYKKDLVSLAQLYPKVVWSKDEQDERDNIQTDLLDYIDKTISSWIVNGGVDSGWDAYIKKCNDLHLKDLISIYQKKLDAFNKS